MRKILNFFSVLCLVVFFFSCDDGKKTSLLDDTDEDIFELTDGDFELDAEGENNEENDEYVDEAVDKDGNDSGNDLDDDDPFSGDDDSFPIDDSQMITIPAGTFSMGCNNAVDSECAADEVPYHEITVSEFRIDKFEVTVSSFRKCITAGSCNNADSQKPHFNTTTSDESCNLGANDKEMHPMNCVSWYGAKAYCEWLGKRLPTEAEWEKAARGDDGRKYPWGNSGLSCDNAVIYDGCGTGTTMVVGSKPGGASPYGVEDMVGNVWEWVNDWYDEYYYTATSNEDPIGPESGTYKVLRGGAWMDSYDKTSDRRTSVRSKHYPNLRQSARGFRCAK